VTPGVTFTTGGCRVVPTSGPTSFDAHRRRPDVRERGGYPFPARFINLARPVGCKEGRGFAFVR